MNVAVLGFDSATLALAAEARRRGHRLVAVADDVPRDGLEALRRLAPDVELSDASELGGDWDAAIVGRFASEDRGLEQLRQLFQSELPIVVSHPVIDSMLAAYELDMTRQANDGVVMAYVAEAYWPAIEDLAALVDDGSSADLGGIERVNMVRRVARTAPQEVLSAFAHDVAWLQCVAGKATSVMAMASAPERLGDLQVQMSTERGIVVRWSVASGGASSVVARGERGELSIALPEAAGQSLIVQRRDGDNITRDEQPPVDAAAAAWDDFEGAIGGQAPAIGWLDAAHALEITDAVRRSLARGRAVDLNLEEQTEHGTFKGVMAAGGCLVLLASLVIVIAGTTAAKFNVPQADLWPFALVGLLGGFLLLQLLRVVFPREDER